MKKLLLLITLIFLASCKPKEKPEIKYTMPVEHIILFYEYGYFQGVVNQGCSFNEDRWLSDSANFVNLYLNEPSKK